MNWLVNSWILHIRRTVIGYSSHSFSCPSHESQLFDSSLMKLTAILIALASLASAFPLISNGCRARLIWQPCKFLKQHGPKHSARWESWQKCENLQNRPRMKAAPLPNLNLDGSWKNMFLVVIIIQHLHIHLSQPIYWERERRRDKQHGQCCAWERAE